eukprot:TRINITY_DN20790_c0_g1_i1.p1 TRINITY_DN20790_c0_g1~~TRINITY_DN20790_c0_g1_i1.p1  ORF type:complete len:429 (+),score=23.45 TRINITY_DN20790_c0_g1_i1:449-1735(+)
MTSPLIDLDELILKCRDDRAKAYISEAVASYRSGAFRSAIVGTWIAVCFDVIEKLRELALSGDKEAEKYAEELEKTRKSGDIAKALKFERELLELARDKFELISHIEFIDLERLQEDRNRCAHPSLISEDQVFSPSAELARVHIHSAVNHLLQHPPVQGKYALDRLVKEVDSEYFPDNKSKAKVSLASGPLRKPRESLVRNFVVVLIKKLLKEDTDWKFKRRVAAALNAVLELQPQGYSATFSEKLSPLLRSLEDTELKRVIAFFELTTDTWQYVEGDVRQRIESFISALPSNLIDDVAFLLSFAPLRKQMLSRITAATREELKNTIFFILPPEVADRLITLYLESRNFDQANEWAKQLAIYASDFNEDQIRRIVTNAAQNEQIFYSFELGALLNVLRSRKKISEEEFDDLLMNNGLSKYAPASAQPA